MTIASNGTILTVGDEVAIEDMPIENLSKNGKALKFMVGETSMVFGFDFYENGKLLRSVINADDQNVQEEGDPLDIEQEGEDFTELIFSLMETVSGDSIYTLEPDVESVRYKFIVGDKKTKIETISPQTSNKKEDILEITEPKPWWKFW